MPRRRLLQLGLGATAGILTTAIGCNNANSETAQTGADPSACNVTPGQTPGPFYPHVKNGGGDVDLHYGQADAPVAIRRDSEILLLDITGYATVDLKPVGKDEFIAYRERF